MQSTFPCIAIALVLSAATACGGGCPKPDAPAASKAEWEAALAKRKVLPLDPKADIAIKRDVHTLIVNVDAKTFADAFHQVMQDPERRFGLIQVNRKLASLGKPFTMGERFQGRYSLEGALKEQLCNEHDRALSETSSDPALAAIVCTIENDAMSDYGEIFQLVLTPAAEGPTEYRFAYRYLDGSPIAGSSTFTVVDVEPGKARVTQTFEYQEQNQSFAVFFSNRGLKLHNQVVFSQVQQSVAKAGGQIVSSDIPDLYKGT